MRRQRRRWWLAIGILALALLALVSLAVLAASVAWGVLGSTRHGMPQTTVAAPSVEAAP